MEALEEIPALAPGGSFPSEVLTVSQNSLSPNAEAFYRYILAALKSSGVPHLIGGAYAFRYYTGIERHTKDFDVFTRRGDYQRVMEALSACGCQTELTFPHWLGKAYCGEDFIDVIFSSGNGIAEVDDEWFDHAVEAEVLDVRLRLCPPEEMIWSKSFVMERERYDGADIAHLLRARAKSLDWKRLLERYGPYWRVLLTHLILFGFVYPSERAHVPCWVMDELLRRLHLQMQSAPPAERICQGTLLSRAQYLIDVESWGYQDARVAPAGGMTEEEVAYWTAATKRVSEP
jgi:hypothetical protein